MRALRRAVRYVLVLAIISTGCISAYAAIFDDGNDRAPISDLRKKPDASLTDTERMILRAADRYGNVGFCPGAGGNATLIDYSGRPAIITSAHMFYDEDRSPKCTAAELRNATFVPNVSYVYDGTPHSREFTHRSVRLVGADLIDNIGLMRRKSDGPLTEDDYIIVYLEEDISRDIMPDGHQRGAFTIGDLTFERRGDITMIGAAPDIASGLTTIYQTCRYRHAVNIGLQHTCDTVRGSSGSAMLMEGNGELTLVGVHAWALHGNAVFPAPNESMTVDWNLATAFPDGFADDPNRRELYSYLNTNEAFLPYHLQTVLARAGCYTGALDNDWGPGSRGAVDRLEVASGTTLPGREPTQELRHAVEAAVAENGELCSQ